MEGVGKYESLNGPPPASKLLDECTMVGLCRLDMDLSLTGYAGPEVAFLTGDWNLGVRQLVDTVAGNLESTVGFGGC